MEKITEYLIKQTLSEKGIVKVWKETIKLPTYEIGEEEKNPIFLEKRVYQGSSGVVYPYPAVKQQVLLDIEEKRKEKTELYVLEAALLLEAGYAKICEETWFIYTEESVRRERLKASRGYSDERITDMIRSQSPEAYFRKNCTRVIDNSKEIEETRRQIGEIL